MSGAFNQQISTYSNDTQNLVKGMLQELNVNQKSSRNIYRTLSNTAPLPSKNALSETPRERNLLKVSQFKPKEKWTSKRSKSVIDERISQQKESLFVPKPPKYIEGSKSRCQELMHKRGKIEPVVHEEPVSITNHDEKDLFTELAEEVQERFHWLEELEKLNSEAAKEYRPMIQAQVSSRIRQLEDLERNKQTS